MDRINKVDRAASKSKSKRPFESEARDPLIKAPACRKFLQIMRHFWLAPGPQRICPAPSSTWGLHKQWHRLGNEKQWFYLLGRELWISGAKVLKVFEMRDKEELP